MYRVPLLYGYLILKVSSWEVVVLKITCIYNRDVHTTWILIFDDLWKMHNWSTKQKLPNLKTVGEVIQTIGISNILPKKQQSSTASIYQISRPCWIMNFQCFKSYVKIKANYSKMLIFLFHLL